MPDERHHRGPHPEDHRLFDAAALPALCCAVGDLAWLLSRDYATPSALKLVGDRYSLTQRQRVAVMRCTCSDTAMHARQASEVPGRAMAGQELLLDGYNVLTTVEAGLSGGVILAGRDGCFRDMASIHGTWRRVEETPPALRLIGQWLATLGVAQCTWYLDSPVSNSGRLKALILEVAAAAGWNWQVELVNNPDVILAEAGLIIASADSVVLDRCARWYNLARSVVEGAVPGAWIVHLRNC